MIKTELLEDKTKAQAKENIEKWGLQERPLLLLAILEELGELTQVYLEKKYESKNNLGDEYYELYDLSALIFQYYIALEWERYGKHEYVEKHKFLSQSQKEFLKEEIYA